MAERHIQVPLEAWQCKDRGGTCQYICIKCGEMKRKSVFSDLSILFGLALAMACGLVWIIDGLVPAYRHYGFWKMW